MIEMPESPYEGFDLAYRCKTCRQVFDDSLDLPLDTWMMEHRAPVRGLDTRAGWLYRIDNDIAREEEEVSREHGQIYIPALIITSDPWISVGHVRKYTARPLNYFEEGEDKEIFSCPNDSPQSRRLREIENDPDLDLGESFNQLSFDEFYKVVEAMKNTGRGNLTFYDNIIRILSEKTGRKASLSVGRV